MNLKKEIRLKKKFEFVDMYHLHKHRTTKEYSKILGVSEPTILKWKNEISATWKQIKIKEFKRLVHLHKYSNTQLARILKIDRRTVINWQNKFFTNNQSPSPQKQRQIYFAKLYEAKTFSLLDIARLLNTTPTSVQRFKREYEKQKAV